MVTQTHEDSRCGLAVQEAALVQPDAGGVDSRQADWEHRLQVDPATKHRYIESWLDTSAT
jgi:hypothetical protein